MLFLSLSSEDTYWKPDVVDQQEVLVKVMDTYGKVSDRTCIEQSMAFFSL